MTDKSQARPLQCYLSHSHTDLKPARTLRNLLLQRFGARVFISEDLSAGENWQEKLRSRLKEADFVIALVTPASVSDSWVLHELGAVWALRKPVLPLVARPDVLEQLPVSLEVVQALTIRLDSLDEPESQEEIAATVKTAIEQLHSSSV
jgi:hypothetical protein